MEEVEKVAGQVLIGGFLGKSLPPEFAAALGEGALGGVILFARNLGTVAEVLALNQEVLGCSGAHRKGPAGAGRVPWICVDQEGGRVARLRAPVLTLPPMRVLGDIGDEGLTERAGRALGAELLALGFNCDFAPVLDVDTNPANPVIGDRSFSRDPATVARHGAAFARGLGASGIIACGKHFPGHGDTDLDSHLALPRVAHGRARLEAVELLPFRETVQVMPSLMTAHVVFDALDPGVPATLSSAVIEGLLRRELGYRGVVVSDDLEMKAVSERYGAGECAVRALRAGCDAVLVCSKMDMLLEAREALAREARGDAAFFARLREAAGRVHDLARAHPPRPAADENALLNALGSQAALGIQNELRSRAG
jgi:beta-N-acetylhexosaminidase